MNRFIQRVLVTVAAEVVAYMISDKIIQRIEKNKEVAVIDTVAYTVK